MGSPANPVFGVKASGPGFLGHVRSWVVSALTSGHHLVLVLWVTHHPCAHDMPSSCTWLSPPGGAEGEGTCPGSPPVLIRPSWP